MKLYRKIDFYFLGEYYASTEQSKTCRDAKKRVLERLNERGEHQLGALENYIRKHPEHLKARRTTK